MKHDDIKAAVKEAIIEMLAGITQTESAPEKPAQENAGVEITLEQVVAAFRFYLTAHGRDKGKEMLDTFGVTGKLSEPGALPVAKYAAFMEALEND